VTSSIHKVMLIYPRFETPLLKKGLYYTAIPLGLAYLAAGLEKNGYSASAVDCNIEPMSPQELAGKIAEHQPDIVGIYVTSLGLRYVKTLIDTLRGGGVGSTIPKIAVGGPHISADPQSSQLLGADTYFSGESEEGFVEYCKNGATAASITCGLADDLDSLPYPARHIFKQDKYGFTSIIASRGCPFNCIYCGMAGTPYRRRSLPNIRGELDLLQETKTTRTIDFADDTFTLDRQYAWDIASLMAENKTPWACTTRADHVDRELIAHMAECGCRHISFGLESGSQRVRYASARG
jgi:anaerobic magnesium-protoporphyrin IX monomethyl ester cyclase